MKRETLLHQLFDKIALGNQTVHSAVTGQKSIAIYAMTNPRRVNYIVTKSLLCSKNNSYCIIVFAIKQAMNGNILTTLPYTQDSSYFQWFSASSSFVKGICIYSNLALPAIHSLITINRSKVHRDYNMRLNCCDQRDYYCYYYSVFKVSPFLKIWLIFSVDRFCGR